MIETHISWAYSDLITTFMKANNLDVSVLQRDVVPFPMINLSPMSPIAEQDLTFFGYKHLGIENMLCDYLKKCGISPEAMNKHMYTPKRNPKELDEQWETYRKEKLGFR